MLLQWIRQFRYSVMVGGLCVLGLSLAGILTVTSAGRLTASGMNPETEAFLKQLDVAAFERNGTDFVSPRFSPLRIGLPLEKINDQADYDFARVAAEQQRLKKVDRQIALKRIFEDVTHGAATNTDKHLALLRFLHKSSFHNIVMPLYPDGSMVMDPLVVLALGEMRCGYVSRLAVDLFESAGFRGRLVQLGGHVVAEVSYDNRWHYFDGDIFGNGETVLKDGYIPSVVELSHDPALLDGLAHYLELPYTGTPMTASSEYPSWFYFSTRAYGAGKGEAVYYDKSATEADRGNRYYGWNVVRTSPDPERTLYDMKLRYQPGAAVFTRIEVQRGPQPLKTVHLSWSESQDLDHDLLGYRVYVSTQSRQWTYGTYTGPARLKPFMTDLGGWKPAMYEKLFQKPPHDVLLLTTSQAFADLALLTGRTYFITVMPYDAYGERVGKVLYQMSDEVQIIL